MTRIANPADSDSPVTDEGEVEDAGGQARSM